MRERGVLRGAPDRDRPRPHRDRSRRAALRRLASSGGSRRGAGRAPRRRPQVAPHRSCRIERKGPDVATEAVIEAGDATFEAEVLERSRELPVVVDFWAPWCGPCRLIGPILERLATEYAGRVRLVKINVDDSPAVAGRFNIHSIPEVMAFRDGRAVSQFTGAVPEPQARAFFEALLPSPADAMALEGARAAAAGQLDAAGRHYGAALKADPDHRAATTGLAALALTGGELERAEELASRWPAEPAAMRVLAQVHFRRAAGDGADRAELESHVAADPRAAAAHYRLGNLLAAAGEWEPALERLLATVRLDRRLDGDGGRLRMLDAFAVLGDAHPLTKEYRRRLSNVLF
ncbi:MAG: thioredoxin [Dehalococcoidia bacterium]|nr:thioredoxin [Dehalococcoidia bacterium]